MRHPGWVGMRLGRLLMTRKGKREMPVETVTRRARAAGGRPHSVRVSLSADEATAIRAAASAAGMAEAAWAGVVLLREINTRRGGFVRASSEMQELMVLRDELAELRRVLRNIGGNLNDVAKHANSTGEVHAATARVQQTGGQGRGAGHGHGWPRGRLGRGRRAEATATRWPAMSDRWPRGGHGDGRGHVDLVATWTWWPPGGRP